MTANLQVKHIIISRTDAIGDVVLTLPMCGYLKAAFPYIKISFLGRTYTKPVVEACTTVDEFINYDELKDVPPAQQAEVLHNTGADCIIHVFPNKHVAKIARAAGIRLRIGTTNRIFHWFTCNKLIKLSRKKSPLHEAQLNMVLLQALGLQVLPLADVHNYYAFKPQTEIPAQINTLLSPDKFNLILHPKSHGSGVEWPLKQFEKLIETLPADRFNIFISGSVNEKESIKAWLAQLPSYIHNITGSMDLYQFISFINKADGLIASGTGPLHVAAASGIYTLGLFPCVRPIHPGRWAPLGKKATYLESDSENLDSVTPEAVANIVLQWTK